MGDSQLPLELLPPELWPFASPKERNLLNNFALSPQDTRSLMAEIADRRKSYLAKLEPTAAQLNAEMHADEALFWQSGYGSPKQREGFLDGIKERWRQKQVIVSPQCEPKPPETIPSISDSESATRKPPLSDSSSEKAKPGTPKDPKPARPHSFPERWPGGRHQGLFDQSSRDSKHSEGSHSEFIWGAMGVLITILAIVVWGLLFVLAGVLYAIGVYRAPWFRRASKKRRFWLKAGIDVAFAVILLAVWLWFPTPEFAKGSKGETPVVNTVSPSPSTTPSVGVQLESTPATSPSIVSRAGAPSPSPAGIPTTTPRTVETPTDGVPVNFDRLVSLKAGVRYRLESLLLAAGYKGPMLLQALFLRNLDENGDNLYWGQADLDPANAAYILPGDGYNFPRGADARQVYLLGTVDMKVLISARSQ